MRFSNPLPSHIFPLPSLKLDSEGEARVVRSQKDRAWDAIRDMVVKIRNARKNQDWSLLQDEFDAVNKKIDKSKMLIMRDGLPKFYIMMLVEVEDAVNEVMNDKAAFKNLKTAAQHSLKRMKLTVKKHNSGYEAQIAACRASPDDYKSDVEEDDDDSDSDEEDDDEDDDDDDDDDKVKPHPPLLHCQLYQFAVILYSSFPSARLPKGRPCHETKINKMIYSLSKQSAHSCLRQLTPSNSFSFSSSSLFLINSFTHPLCTTTLHYQVGRGLGLQRRLLRRRVIGRPQAGRWQAGAEGSGEMAQEGGPA